ncbi:MAG: leucine dehydrogenase [Candidatus Niyogibacteria bacterium]|nr:leucine dehydrogenase [Candidatus Niyogibacteria bacterium]
MPYAYLNPEFDGHELEAVFFNKKVNKSAIIAIHRKIQGRTIGGFRIYPYPTFHAARTDVLRLSAGMTRKAVMANLPVGGAKGVLIANPDCDKNEALYQFIAECINALGGQYVTAEDAGFHYPDAFEVAKYTRHIAGLANNIDEMPFPDLSNISDLTSQMTALGVFEGIRVCLRRVFGCNSCEGRSFAVQGLGKTGYPIARFIHQAGGRLVIADIDQEKTKRASAEFGGSCSVVSIEEIFASHVDVFVPCSLGGITIAEAQYRIVAGSANNALLSMEDGDALHQKGILYAPDYIINSGGLRKVYFETLNGGYNHGALLHTIFEEIPKALETIFDHSEKKNLPAHRTAEKIYQEKLAALN